MRARIDDGLVVSHWDMRLLHTVAGLAAAAGRRWEIAEEHYRTALRQAEDLPHRLEQPEVHRFHAMMVMDRGAPGDLDLAVRLLRESAEEYRRLGMSRHVVLADRLRASAGGV